ncbi:MAG TPA: CARDB domain-containing protein, partial [Thermoleophilaceae bacterium]
MRIALVAALALVIAAPAAEARAPRPDLRITSVSLGKRTALAGDLLKVGDATKNSGRAAARASTTTYYLSTVRHHRDYRIGARSVKRLQKGKSSRAAAVVRIPPSIQSGLWFVIACSDSGRKVRESNERNNCRASASRVAVAIRIESMPEAVSAPVIAGCRILPDDNPWNRNISQDAVDPMSDTYIRYMGSSPGADWNLRQDWGTGDEPFYG